jgi:SnoaL-like domain
MPETSAELEQLAQESHAAWERGDKEWFEAHLSAHDPIMLGSAPEEEMVGADAINEITSEELANRDQYAFKPTAPRIIDARESGDIGWTVTESRWEFEDGSYLPVRGLTVLHREDGMWKLIAAVAAPAISNELLRPGSPIVRAAARQSI